MGFAGNFRTRIGGGIKLYMKSGGYAFIDPFLHWLINSAIQAGQTGEKI
jgi:hypothetical protein